MDIAFMFGMIIGYFLMLSGLYYWIKRFIVFIINEVKKGKLK